MLRKIHSNRDPRDTIFTELRKEFRPYLDKAGERLKRSSERHPKPLFYTMVISICISTVLSFFVFRTKKEPPKNKQQTLSSPAVNGFEQILETGKKLKETIYLKRQIDSLSGKKELTAADSLKLESALDRLQVLNKQFAIPRDSLSHQNQPPKINEP
jgi:hypothetical protein